LWLKVNNKESVSLCDFEAHGDMGECCSENGSKNVSPKQSGTNLDEKIRRDILILEKEANYKVNLSELAAPKRLSYLSWDDYFMCVAYLSAQRSKDPNTQVGACIVNSMKRIAGVGYNGFPQGCSDDILPWNRSNEGNGEGAETKYLYVCHAEANAILNKGGADIHGSTIYVDLFPCNECAKMIIQTGIKEVVYLRDTYHDDDKCRASRIMFQMSGVTYRQHQLSVKQILLDLKKGESSYI
jgi:dCMP deaminase